jgi:hypothetical protein
MESAEVLAHGWRSRTFGPQKDLGEGKRFIEGEIVDLVLLLTIMLDY